MTLTPHQLLAFNQIKAFLADDSRQTFVLKGYAGTGKTTLIGKLADHLVNAGRPFQLLATTGRAANVLHNKTGHKALTLHSCLYDFDELTGDPEQEGNAQMQLRFSLRSNLMVAKEMVYIVDEASMITHETAREDHTARFGSGRLLHDFFQFLQNRKAIFVGDPCQLPPIAENPFSSALDANFLNRELKARASELELTEIMRQRANSEILRLATSFRESLRRGYYEKYPKVGQPAGAQASLAGDERDLVRRYVDRIRNGQYADATMIVNANWHVNELNQEIRAKLFPGNRRPQPGELLMVVQNNHLAGLANGDQAVVVKVKPSVRIREFDFLEVELRAVHSGETVEALLIENLLYDKKPGLNSDDMQSLQIDFHYRMKAKGISKTSDAFYAHMRTDPYLNALRAKFGYAITCHKAQGGEWPHVYLNIHPKIYGMPGPNLYRWYYTALTRAQQHLHLNDGWWIQGFNARNPSSR